MVAFGENGLTRRTDGAKMLGVISRRAVVSGSMPEEAVRAQWDQVSPPVDRFGRFTLGCVFSHDGACCRWRTAASFR